MAMYDWNRNGKNDPVDDYLEYQIYNNCKSDNDRPHHTQSSGGISTFGAVFSMICGMVLQAFIYTVFGIDVKDVPAVILLILWVSAIVSSFLDNIPFVATLIPLILTMQSSGVDVTPLWWAVSLGACLGGNGTLIGASANVVLSGISTRHGFPITFASYLKVGFPMMLVSVAISTVFLLIRFG